VELGAEKAQVEGLGVVEVELGGRCGLDTVVPGAEEAVAEVVGLDRVELLYDLLARALAQAGDHRGR